MMFRMAKVVITGKKIGIGVAGLILVSSVVLWFLLPQDVRAGLSVTVKGTVSDTLSIAGVGDKSEPVNTGVVEASQEVTGVDILDEGVSAPVLSERPPMLSVAVLDTVGDAVIVKDTESGQAMLLNAGYAKDEAKVRSAMQKWGIKRFRYIIFTNYLDSSIGNMSKIMTTVSSDYLIFSDNILFDKNRSAVVNKTLSANGLIGNQATDFSRYTLGDTNFRLLNTHKDGSLGVLLSTGKTNVLITGSATRVEDTLVQQIPQDIDGYVVTVPEDRYSIPQKVLDVSKPKLVALNDEKGSFTRATGKVIKSVETLGSTIERTSQKGSFVINSDGELLTLAPFK